MSPVAQQKINICLPLKCEKIIVRDGQIKTFESNQKPDHKKALHILLFTARHSWIIEGRKRRKNREEMKLQQQEREALYFPGRCVRLFGGFATAAGKDLTRAGTVPQAWPG